MRKILAKGKNKDNLGGTEGRFSKFCCGERMDLDSRRKTREMSQPNTKNPEYWPNTDTVDDDIYCGYY